jgi:hypothetical protein
VTVLGRVALLVAGRRAPGVYAAHVSALPGTIAAALRAHDVPTAALDTAGIHDKAAFLECCARDLSLPAWFGRNWDALADVLRERRGVLVWSGAGDLDADVVAVALDVLRERAAAAPPFSAVLLDPPGALALPAL